MDGEVRAARCGDEYFFHRLFVCEPRVEVVGAPSGGEREVAGVYVVRADLVWVDAQAARGERGDYSARYRRFSAAACTEKQNELPLFYAAAYIMKSR